MTLLDRLLEVLISVAVVVMLAAGFGSQDFEGEQSSRSTDSEVGR
jgi:hypothetical protein